MAAGTVAAGFEQERYAVAAAIQGSVAATKRSAVAELWQRGFAVVDLNLEGCAAAAASAQMEDSVAFVKGLAVVTPCEFAVAAWQVALDLEQKRSAVVAVSQNSVEVATEHVAE